MTKRAITLTARARAEGDPGELITWCAQTPDLMSFREALRRISADRWPDVQSQVTEALGAAEPNGAALSGHAAERALRGRSAARSLKLQMLLQEAGNRATRDPDARAQRRLPRPVF